VKRIVGGLRRGRDNLFREGTLKTGGRKSGIGSAPISVEGQRVKKKSAHTKMKVVKVHQGLPVRGKECMKGRCQERGCVCGGRKKYCSLGKIVTVRTSKVRGGTPCKKKGRKEKEGGA